MVEMKAVRYWKEGFQQLCVDIYLDEVYNGRNMGHWRSVRQYITRGNARLPRRF